MQDEDEDEDIEDDLVGNLFVGDGGLSLLLKLLLVSMMLFCERFFRSERGEELFLVVGEYVEGDIDYEIWFKVCI